MRFLRQLRLSSGTGGGSSATSRPAETGNNNNSNNNNSSSGNNNNSSNNNNDSDRASSQTASPAGTRPRLWTRKKSKPVAAHTFGKGAVSIVASEPSVTASSDPPVASAEPSLQSRTEPWSPSHKASLKSRRYLADAETSCLPMDVQELIAPGDLEMLLRASRLSNLLRKCCSIYRNSAGSAATYNMSAKVDRIDVFISHNWIVSWFYKTLALVLHFNFDIAARSLVVFTVVCMGGYLLNVLPHVDEATSIRGNDGPTGLVCGSLVSGLFLATLLVARDVMWRLGYHGPSTFLDKTCIHQTDTQLQIRGIKCLGAFLCRTEQVVVLFSRHYLRRLWTVYEVAAFLSVSPSTRMIVLPLSQAVTYWTLCIVAWLWQLWTIICGRILQMEVAYLQLAFQCVAPFIIGLSLVTSRYWARQQQSTLTYIRSFSLKDTVCAVESDRRLIYQNIATLMRASDSDLQGADQATLLTAFEHRVRTDVLEAFAESMSAHSWHYKHILVLAYCISGNFVDYFPRLWREDQDLVAWVSVQLTNLISLMIFWPGTICIILHLGRSCIHLRGLCEVIYLLFVICVMMGYAVGHAWIEQAIEKKVNESPSGLWYKVGWGLFGAILVGAAFFYVDRVRGGSMKVERTGSERDGEMERPEALPRLLLEPQREEEEEQEEPEKEHELQGEAPQNGSAAPDGCEFPFDCESDDGAPPFLTI